MGPAGSSTEGFSGEVTLSLTPGISKLCKEGLAEIRAAWGGMKKTGP